MQGRSDLSIQRLQRHVKLTAAIICPEIDISLHAVHANARDRRPKFERVWVKNTNVENINLRFPLSSIDLVYTTLRHRSTFSQIRQHEFGIPSNREVRYSGH